MKVYKITLVVHHAECVEIEASLANNIDEAIALAKEVTNPKFHTIKMETVDVSIDC
jgi:hypothetical protein